jgi:tungstate transport system ATP-binding protein
MSGRSTILPLSLEAINFAAGGKQLLDNVNFTLPGGGVTVMLGPNGAGKSLILRLCHGLLEPTGGAVRWQASGAQVHMLRHAMVFQRPVMLRRSVIANIRHALVAARQADPAGRAEAALARFGLEALAAQPARHLSGGEQQRVAIARAWALQPEVLFLDEPTAQLDPGATRQIEHMIASLAADGMTILLTTHDLGQARRLGDRVLFVANGRLIEDAPAADFFTGPRTAEARMFLAGDLPWGGDTAAG